MAAALPLPSPHHWYTPAECAAMLGGEAHGDRFRAPCPAHRGSNPTALGIAQGRDRDGNPMTLLHCFANQCPVEDICAAMGLEVKDLFCIHPIFARDHRHVPRARSPRVSRLRTMQEPSPDDIAQILLEEMIVSDPPWIQACAPARAKLWELAQASHKTRALFSHALHIAGLRPSSFWDVLAREMEGPS
jgi:hypothetical protein